MSKKKQWIITLLLYFPAYFFISGTITEADRTFFRFMPYSVASSGQLRFISDFMCDILINFLFYLLIFSALATLTDHSGEKKTHLLLKKRNLLITLIATLVSYFVIGVSDTAITFSWSYFDILLYGSAVWGIIIAFCYPVLRSVLWVLTFAVIFSMTSEPAVPLSQCLKQMFRGKYRFVALGIILASIVTGFLQYVSWQSYLGLPLTGALTSGSLIDIVSLLAPPVLDYDQWIFLGANLGCMIAAAGKKVTKGYN